MTERTPGSSTYGPGIGKVADAMGTPLMPWQQAAADLIGEVDARGRFRHRTVVLSVPRQSGKTALMGAVYVHRCLIKAGARVWHTQQTGQHARETWRKLLADQFEPSIFAPLAKAMKSAGSENLRFTNRAQLRPHPPTADSLHGEQSDLNGIDEAWTFDEDEGRDLLQAIIPTQATRPGAQTIIYSTRGTAASTWFHDMIDAIAAGKSGAALIDYGIPNDAPADVDTVCRHHPAVGHTIGRDTIDDALDTLGTAGFARAYGNRATASRRSLIPAARLDATTWQGDRPAGHRWHFAAAVAHNRADAAIAAATIVDGRPLAAIVATGTGSGWTARRLAELVDTWDAPPPLVDRVGPASTVADELERAETPIAELTARDVMTATADMLDRLDPADPDAEVDVWLKKHPALWSAIDAAATRTVGDSIMLSRKGSAGSVATFEAVILATYSALRPDPDPVPPMIWT